MGSARGAGGVDAGERGRPGTGAVSAPDRLLLDLAHYKASDPDCNIRKAHVYPLGGLRRSAAWTYAVLDGALTLRPDGRGFTVDREIA